MSADVALEEDPKSDSPQDGAKVLSSTIQHDTHDADSHQPSLEGILAMIESAVYPHCAVASSPAGSDTTASESHTQDRTTGSNAGSVEVRTADKENVERDRESQVETDDAVSLPPSTPLTHDTLPTITLDQPLEDGTIPTSHQRTLRHAAAQLQTPDANDGRDDDFKSASSDESGPLPAHPINVSVDEDQGTDDETTGGSATRRDLADLVDVEEESRSPIEKAQSSDAEKLVGESDCRDPPLPMEMDSIEIKAKRTAAIDTLSEPVSVSGLDLPTATATLLIGDVPTTSTLPRGGVPDLPRTADHPSLANTTQDTDTLHDAPSTKEYAVLPLPCASAMFLSAGPTVEQEQGATTVTQEEKREESSIIGSTDEVENGAPMGESYSATSPTGDAPGIPITEDCPAQVCAPPNTSTMHEAPIADGQAESTALHASPLPLGAGNIRMDKEDVIMTDLEDEKREEPLIAGSSCAIQAGESSGASEAVSRPPAPSPIGYASVLPLSDDHPAREIATPGNTPLHSALSAVEHADSLPSYASPLLPADESANTKERSMITATTEEEDKKESLIMGPTTAIENGALVGGAAVSPIFAYPDALIPLQDCRDDEKCLTDPNDGPLPNSLAPSGHIEPSTTSEGQEELPVDSEADEAHTSGLSPAMEPPSRLSPSDDHLLRPTAFTLSANESAHKESELTDLCKRQLRPLAQNDLIGPVLQTKKHKIRRTYSMPVSESSVFYEQPGADAAPVSLRAQKQKRGVAESNGGIHVKRQRSNVLDRIASPLAIMEESGTSTTWPEARNASEDTMSYAKGFASETQLVEEDTDVRMHSCDDVPDTAPGPAEEGLRASSDPIQDFSLEASATANHVEESSVSLVPDSGRPAEKSRHCAGNPALLETPQADEHDEQQENISPATERPLVVFTRFKRPQPLAKQVFPAAQPTPHVAQVPTCALTPPPTEDRKRKSAPESSIKAREARAVKKLKQPFKSPMLSADAIAKPGVQTSSPATRDSLVLNALPCKSPTANGKPPQHQTESYEFASEPGPQRLRANHIVTKRLANTFSSPFSSPLKGADTTSPASVSHQPTTRSDSSPQGINLMADISALERQKQILKQAIKIRNSPAEEERLGDLVAQWRQAGRDIVEMLYQAIPKPEPAAEGGILPSSVWENGFKPLEPDTIAKSAEEKEENAEAEDWNYGTMMRTLQVDPDLLGWDREAEDWVGS